MDARTLAGVALAALLAGCSSSPSAPTQSADLDFRDLEVQATATTGVIRGVVLDPAIRPVAGAVIGLSGSDRTETSNGDGLFAFSSLEPGTYFLSVAKSGYNGTQTSAEVVAGVDDPPITKVLLQPNPATTPYVEAFHFRAFITCGAAVVATSVGCNTFPAIGQDILGDRVYFDFDFTLLPAWSQGELVWEHTQPAGGQMIWEIVSTGNSHIGYRETTGSPALAYLDDEAIDEHNETILENGITYRIFGGPHDACSGVAFGCGLTLNQALDAYVHNFYNFRPEEGWRFTSHGDPVPPP